MYLVETYLHSVTYSMRVYPDNFNSWYLIKIFPKWLIKLNGNSLEDEVPFVCFSLISFLKKNIEPNMRIYEFGSGGSTLFFAKHAYSVVSIEHDKKWRDLVSRAISLKKYNNCNIRLIEPSIYSGAINKDFSNPNYYLSSDFADKSFLDYSMSIEDYPDNYFDIVLIDGRARPSCIKHSINKVKEKGYLILDDSERGYYLDYFKSSSSNFNKLFDKIRVFYGPAPYSVAFKEATIWQKVSRGDIV